MKKKNKRSGSSVPHTVLLRQLKKITEELRENQETLRVIQSGEIDALVLNGEAGVRIFTLKNADQPYRIMVETMSEGAATLTPDGTLFYCNRQFSELLRVPLKNLIGSSIYSLLFESDVPTVREALEQGKKLLSRNAFVLTWATGSKVTTQVSISSVDIEGQYGVCMIVTDLTEQRRAEDELRRSRDLLEFRVEERTAELAKAVRVRDDFLCIASHELRTPLTSLKMQAQLNKRRILKEDYAYFDHARLRTIFSTDDRQINRLTRLVDDMLDLSRLSTGKLSLEPKETDICQVVSETISRFMPELESLGVQVDFDSNLPIVGYWDSFRIEQIFTNLLTNALKYGLGKPIQVEVQADGANVKLVVRDQGLGIEAKDLQRIFERFERAISADEVSGLGLGLYIVKQLVEAHHGAVWAESEPGIGTAFTVKIPLRPPLYSGSTFPSIDSPDKIS